MTPVLVVCVQALVSPRNHCCKGMSRLYEETLGSPRWKQLKWRRIMCANFCCEDCGRKYRGKSVRGAMKVFELHHRHYRNVGQEELEDVKVLCSICHAIYHDKVRM